MKTIKQLKTSEYLYDTNGNTFKDLNIITALELKIDLSKKLIDKLQLEHFSVRDDMRIKDSSDSQDFNRRLIDEMLEKI